MPIHASLVSPALVENAVIIILLREVSLGNRVVFTVKMERSFIVFKLRRCMNDFSLTRMMPRQLPYERKSLQLGKKCMVHWKKRYKNGGHLKRL